MLTCPFCGHSGEDVIEYLAKVGGPDQVVRQVHCADIDACLARQLTDRAERDKTTSILNKIMGWIQEYADCREGISLFLTACEIYNLVKRQ